MAIGVNSNKAKLIWVPTVQPCPQVPFVTIYSLGARLPMVNPMVTILQLATTTCSSEDVLATVCAR